MEEKERYKWSQDIIVECPYEDYDYIVDTKNNIIFDDDNFFKLIDLLNQQDKRIKDLQDEQVKEMLEHQEAMELANITITNLQDRVDKLEQALIDSDLELRVCYKALELASVNVAEYLEQAREILKNE